MRAWPSAHGLQPRRRPCLWMEALGHSGRARRGTPFGLIGSPSFSCCPGRRHPLSKEDCLSWKELLAEGMAPT